MDASTPFPPTPTGGRVNYYLTRVEHPQREDQPPYQAECEDIIQALEMTFDEACIFKAIWRSAAARQGTPKPGHSAIYDAEKMVHYSKRNLLRLQRLARRGEDLAVFAERVAASREALNQAIEEHLRRQTGMDAVFTFEASSEAAPPAAPQPQPQVEAQQPAAHPADMMSDERFLTHMLICCRAGTEVTAAEVARLRALADWAEGAAPAPGWTGTINREEGERAVRDARRRLSEKAAQVTRGVAKAD